MTSQVTCTSSQNKPHVCSLSREDGKHKSEVLAGHAKICPTLWNSLYLDPGQLDCLLPQCAHPILQESHLRDLIKLDPITRVNPDKDVQPAGQFDIYNASRAMSAIYSPERAFLGSMGTKRIETLSQAYQNTKSPELGDFTQEIAKLIARYKDGSKSGTHIIAYKNC